MSDKKNGKDIDLRGLAKVAGGRTRREILAIAQTVDDAVDSLCAAKRLAVASNYSDVKRFAEKYLKLQEAYGTTADAFEDIYNHPERDNADLFKVLAMEEKALERMNLGYMALDYVTTGLAKNMEKLTKSHGEGYMAERMRPTHEAIDDVRAFFLKINYAATNDVLKANVRYETHKQMMLQVK
ncbi:MAG: hypothetical protein ABIJ08_06155 [Nanoarchaeota archaeon]